MCLSGDCIKEKKDKLVRCGMGFWVSSLVHDLLCRIERQPYFLGASMNDEGPRGQVGIATLLLTALRFQATDPELHP